jgi:hypothetical protein
VPADVYVPPKLVTRLEDCVFYHTMEIPGVGLVEGQWDLRESADAYLGHAELADRRVLELGKASGFLTFHMERAGAEVVAYDLSSQDDWDVVPMARLEGRSQADIHALYPPGVQHWRDFLRIRREGIERLNNGFWLAHRAFGSRARLVTGTAYAVPEAIGPVDVATFGSILLHLRDPFLALQRGLRLAREAAIVTDLAPDTVQHVAAEGDAGEAARARALGAYAKFIPDPRAGGPLDLWWQLSPELVVRMLAILGFEDAAVTHSAHRFQGAPIPLYTVVARRTVPMEPLA